MIVPAKVTTAPITTAHPLSMQESVAPAVGRLGALAVEQERTIRTFDALPPRTIKAPSTSWIIPRGPQSPFSVWSYSTSQRKLPSGSGCSRRHMR
jgi:hypothetical protein